MFHSLRRHKRMPILSTDGKMGELLGFFFDEDTWQIHCLVVDTGFWLAGRKMLIPADRLGALKAGEERLYIDTTRERIKNSLCLASTESTGGETQGLRECDYHILEQSGEISLVGMAHGITGTFGVHGLRGTDEVKGYAVHATDGEIGHLIDFIFDDESWIIRYLVVDTGGLWPGRKVLLSPEWIESMSWYESMVQFTVTRGSVKTAPSCDPFKLPDIECEEKIFDHYKRPGYWIPSDVVREPGLEGIAGTESR